MRILAIALHVANFFVELQIVRLQTSDLGPQFRDYLELLAKFLGGCEISYLMQASKTTYIYLFKFSIALTEAVALAGDDGKNGCIGGGCKWYRFGLYRRIFLPIAGIKI